jgi:hypothetical protein
VRDLPKNASPQKDHEIMNNLKPNLLLPLGLIAVFALVSTLWLRAQPMLSPAQLAALRPIDHAVLPACASYWLVNGPNPEVAWPPTPVIPPELSALNLPVYSLGSNSFLIDDSNVDYAAMDEADPADETESEDGPRGPYISYPSGSLWLALVMTNDSTYGRMAAVTLGGTTNGFWYEILSKRTPTDPDWWSEGSLQGFTNQADSQGSVTADSSTRSVFLYVRVVTNGSGGTLPLCWQLQNFGRTGLDPSSDPGGCGTNLLQSYLQGTEPNIISFSVTATNNYFKDTHAVVQLEIASGMPFYQSVLVDSTDFAAATWSACTSTNLSVDLGSSDGWHDIWIGLRGFSASSHPTWKWKRLKLDRSPPRLSLVGPAAGVITLPVIQLLGSCPEALSTIWYDLTNTAGLLPHQQVLILDQYLNTNTWEFTTNTFQAFDVRLASGTNTLTLHATDLASNQTTTNFTFILDYSNKTNPPAIQLDWPQDGIEVGASSVTVHGWLEDPTAVVRAQATGTNGIPRTYVGLVERTGRFWIDNIQLGAGTNWLALTITNAAGKGSSTNISILQSGVMMTMNPVVPASQLWQPTVDVGGTISEPSYAVWINGIKANNPGNGTWMATNVPVSKGGAALFQMTAYSPSEVQPDGSYGN